MKIFLLTLIFLTPLLAGCKSKISEEQWKGYSKCLERMEPKFTTISKTSKFCRKLYDIPPKKESKNPLQG